MDKNDLKTQPRSLWKMSLEFHLLEVYVAAAQECEELELHSPSALCMTIVDNIVQDYNEQKTPSDHTHDEAS